MPSYTVYFTKVTEIIVKVDAEDYEAAIDAAYDEIPGLSAHDSGWGKTWSRSESDEAEIEAVENTDTGETEWEANERWTRERLPQRPERTED